MREAFFLMNTLRFLPLKREDESESRNGTEVWFTLKIDVCMQYLISHAYTYILERRVNDFLFFKIDWVEMIINHLHKKKKMNCAMKKKKICFTMQDGDY